MNLAVMILQFYRAIYPNGKHTQKVTSCVKWGEKGREWLGKADKGKDKVYFVLDSSLILSVVGTCQFYSSK